MPVRIAEFSGASARRVVDRSGAHVAAHAHDWPLLSLFVLGGYRNRTEVDELEISQPSAVLYRAGAVHENTAGAYGFEQLEIEFDPDWLACDLPRVPVLHAFGGEISDRARAVVTAWRSGGGEARLRRLTTDLIETMARTPTQTMPANVHGLADLIRSQPEASIQRFASARGLNAGWLGARYHHVLGESVRETAARMRLETAARLLRETDEPAAEIAVEAGFCDQSHMVRTCKRILGRTPSEVRADRTILRAA
jgi:AraC-like DNA-binding protein